MIDSFKGRFFFLSNFFESEVVHRGIKYPSVEHFYVAMKINTDQMINGVFYTLADCRELISKIPTSGQVKRFGRSLSLRKDWDDVRLKVMEFGVREKFKNENLRNMLINTGDEELIEGNYWHDIWWGVCTCDKCGGKGENHLGKILMKVRSDIKNSSPKIITPFDDFLK